MSLNYTKMCQFCGEEIDYYAQKCPMCGEWQTNSNNNIQISNSCGIGFRNPIVIAISIIFVLALLFLVFKTGRYNSPFPYLFMSILGVATYGYLLPSIIAFSKKHPDFILIFIVNIFLGGTGIAWILTILWATNRRRGIF